MIKVFMPCSGLGHVKRGFESFTQECFDILADEPSIQVTLFKGGGDAREKEVTLWNLRRSDWRANQIGKLTGRSGYNIEQSTFFFSLLPHIYRQNPDIIYLSDINLSHALWHWRRLTKKRYTLLLSNGAPQQPPFSRWDHVQQLTPFHLQQALDAGVPAEKQSLVPYGFHLSSQLERLTSFERKALRSQLGLPEEQSLILSVGLIDKNHKRMDYLIREVASLPQPRPYLLLLGQKDAESMEVINLGLQLLGSDNFEVRTVKHHEVCNYYQVADIFVLASLREGLPRVLVEAMSYGLPCLVHDYAITQFVVGKDGYLANFQLKGSLAGLIHEVLTEGYSESKCYLRHRNIYNRFSWTQLRPYYIDMIRRCANVEGNGSLNHPSLFNQGMVTTSGPIVG
jgi:1,2-diacylglycerol 3-alpha-glucosyltransferase